ncbi:MAG: hypothetical protein SOY64_09470 [Pyramidobacter sp.]|nr:hypothetical protein [Pyramidobacter sp.]MDY4033266.1 hypothetical protein [Pyramidobacter sp.]
MLILISNKKAPLKMPRRRATAPQKACGARFHAAFDAPSAL